MNTVKNRWLIALSAVGIHLSIGSIYAWSKIGTAVQEQLDAHWSLKQITLTFGIAIFFLGVSAACMGHFVEKKGPRAAGRVAACFFGVGVTLGGYALKIENLYMLYICYGMLGGIGLGVGYVTPVSTLVKWFPDKRGLATGMAIMGFGFGAAVQIILLQKVFPAFGLTSIATSLMILGPIYFVIMFASAQYLAPPPKDWAPEGFSGEGASKKKTEDLAQLTANEAIKTPRFYFLWLMLFINVTCGIALISVAKNMGSEVIQLGDDAAALFVVLMSLCNGLGRIAWSAFSDFIGRPLTYVTFFVLQIACFLWLSTFFGREIASSDQVIFQGIVLLILTCYGGGFSAVPAFIGDLFGTKQLGAIHGYMLTAWAAAGLTGSTLIAYVKDATGSYQNALYVFTGFFVVALVISIVMILNIKKLRAEKDVILEAQPA